MKSNNISDINKNYNLKTFGEVLQNLGIIISKLNSDLSVLSVDIQQHFSSNVKCIMLFMSVCVFFQILYPQFHIQCLLLIYFFSSYSVIQDMYLPKSNGYVIGPVCSLCLMSRRDSMMGCRILENNLDSINQSIKKFIQNNSTSTRFTHRYKIHLQARSFDLEGDGSP